ncbi:MAG TPA: hypothetical protein VL992_02110, partial [Tepidisphaeraceae bacterium]|nr:hypothetical protein [Tepidisphaeraceae bacterium]
DPKSPPDAIAILGITEGIRQTDSIELFPAPVRENGSFETRLFLHGLQHFPAESVDRIDALKPGERLYLVWDFNASGRLAARTDDPQVLIGYLPRYLQHDIWEGFHAAGAPEDFAELTVERINPGAPLEYRILCRLRADWPQDAEPFSEGDFEPIPEHLPAHSS